ncbi:SDR family oxidoreductase [Streptomyces sp. NPDC051572]|uniref:SDR family NAD(P)-dependent oxidoreductase n=1 Tax=unclassified Streptomyces TaxID=2593676 RepID=UPI00344DF18A
MSAAVRSVPSALVTGASRGIGLAVARRLAKSGYSLTLCARDAERLDAVADELSPYAPAVRTVSADMAIEEDVLRVARVHEAEHGRADVLVVAAGVGTAGDLRSLPVRRFDKQFAVNVRAPFLLVQALLPLLSRTAAAHPSSGAKIIALSSITGVYPEAGLSAYGASKSALIALCKAVNAEVSESGVSATAICPGYVDTDMTAWVRDRIDPSRMISTDDIAELAMSIARLSPYAVVSEIVVTRPGTQLHRA